MIEERTCRWCSTPLPKEATSRREFCDDECRTQWNRNASAEEKRQARAERPRRYEKKLKPLSKFPSYFDELFLPIAQGKLQLEGNKYEVQVSTFSKAYKVYQQWEQYVDALGKHAEREAKKGREFRPLAEDLYLRHTAAAKWKVTPKLPDGRSRPASGEKEAWSWPGFIIFQLRFNDEDDQKIVEGLTQLIDANPKRAAPPPPPEPDADSPSTELDELFFQDED
jgi:hypothetical protein